MRVVVEARLHEPRLSEHMFQFGEGALLTETMLAAEVGADLAESVADKGLLDALVASSRCAFPEPQSAA
jgi:hypothetical protein